MSVRHGWNGRVKIELGDWPRLRHHAHFRQLLLTYHIRTAYTGHSLELNQADLYHLVSDCIALYST